ncbi:aspartyl protease family protein [Alicyclobacillus sp. SO9]|uniref:aspartyl protease family protein n=1 Tax=Alicyclobacillus sp. SO9 TaxID=2665646 RepID=UPI0018E84663|nr:aspartyl protease family protein [Alicyclobacillus sp. SO9]QQE77847.1 aspartyl protease family protein [Alicyclobacillus sp. SO9]
MRIEYSHGLLLASLTITYRGQSKVIDRMAVDTGAAQTIVVSDAVDEIGISFDISDPINRSFGAGGTDYAFEKTVDSIEFNGYRMSSKPLDFGQIDWDINGLIGLDILIPGRFIINFDTMEIYAPGVR